jgi:ribosomal-protein-alanine N-acetyltransferase
MIEVRRATVSDIPRLMAMCEVEENAPRWSRRAYDELILAAETGEALLLVAHRDQDEVIGFYAARRLVEREWELESIIVDPHVRRSGVGALLMKDLIFQIQSGNGRLLLEVRASNTLARRLYEKLGGSETGRRKDYYRDPVEDAVLYDLQLSAP